MARTKAVPPVKREPSNGWIDHRLVGDVQMAAGDRENKARVQSGNPQSGQTLTVSPQSQTIPEQIAHAQDSAGLTQLIICVGGIYTAFITWGILQERITTTPYRTPGKDDGEIFTQTIFLNSIQSSLASLVGYAYLVFASRNKLSTPPVFPSRGIVGPLFLVGLTAALASPFGYASLKHAGYVTYILAKSCKLLPVMFLRVLLYRTRYPMYKYVVVALVTAGVAIFAVYNPSTQKKASKSHKNPDQNLPWGLFLLSINLLFDGLTNSTQDYINSAFKPFSGPQMMCAVNSICTLLNVSYLLAAPQFTRILPASILSPSAAAELSSAVAFIQRHPVVLQDITLFAACGAFGQTFIFYTLNKFSSLLLTTVTVTRKMLTMLLSVVLYGHHLTSGQWAGVTLVFSGVAAEAGIGRWKKQRTQKAFAHDQQSDLKKSK
ncbi:MAG: hypothetical protein Q9162_005233 [Coniocarpon cinnabarinum]